MFNNFRLIVSYARLIYFHTQRLSRAVRFVARSVFRWEPTLRWIHFIEHHDYLKRAPDYVRRVLSDKIHRPYALCTLNVSDRVKALISHYEVMERLFPEPVILQMVSGQKQTLAEIEGQHDKETYAITLCREMFSQHQGELTLLMIDPKMGIHLTRLILNFSHDGAENICLILNGIQGPGPEYKNRIVRVTRNLDGLRPKRAIMEVACAIARAVGAHKIVAIGKKNHVSQTKKKWQLRNRTDYDSFWQEFNAQSMADGNYAIPLELERRDPQEVPSKKRKAAVSRYALLDKLSANVEKSLRELLIR
jgi:uncharacterized protein VirK/YbjX